MQIEINNVVKAPINQKRIKSILKQALKILKPRTAKSKFLSVAVVDGKAIKKLNKKYRKIDKITDVLSFGSLRQDEMTEIIICWSRLKEQAKQFKHSQKQELIILLIHGLLHLIGYDDKTKKERAVMEKITEKVVKRLAR